MLDFRINTFIELCKTKNYTKTAENLHMTQPAVTQHIKCLEEFYKCKLFSYNKKVLSITEQGKLLYKYMLTMSSDIRKIQEEIEEMDISKRQLRFGATLTIGEFVMPKILQKLVDKYPEINISLIVRDTSELLEELKNGKIDFAFIEGYFEKTEYEAYLFSKEDFVGVCSPSNPLAKKCVKFEDMIGERILLREIGSGSRDIFEKILYDNNLSINNFAHKYELENIHVIKELVKSNQGISFVYKKAVEKELENGEISLIKLENFNGEREFNFVFMKDTLHIDEYNNWFKFMKKIFATVMD